MIVKKFQAQTEKEAIVLAKAELGNGAVVLNVKTLKQRGIFRIFKKDIVEITAALEEKDFASEIKANRSSGGNNNSTIKSFDFLADEKLEIVPDTGAIEKKLNSLHNLLSNQIDKGFEFEKSINDMDSSKKEEQNKVKENSNFKYLRLIYNKLIENEVDDKYANMIIGEIESSIKRESNIDSLLAGVYQKIILKLGEPKPIVLGKKPKIAFFVGPTGVGKTTTIAKIASSFKLENQSRVAFITADTYRIAAVEQLNTYASIINCPVNVIYSADEIEEYLRLYESFDLILVDTAGRSHKAEEQITEIMDLLQKASAFKDIYDIEVFLTLSITTKYKDLVRITKTYKDIPEYKIIFTKLDETCSLGNILNIKLLTNADLSYTTSGQNVPNDFEIINEQGLAKQLLGGND